MAPQVACSEHMPELSGGCPLKGGWGGAGAGAGGGTRSRNRRRSRRGSYAPPATAAATATATATVTTTATAGITVIVSVVQTMPVLCRATVVVRDHPSLCAGMLLAWVRVPGRGGCTRGGGRRRSWGRGWDPGQAQAQERGQGTAVTTCDCGRDCDCDRVVPQIR